MQARKKPPFMRRLFGEISFVLEGDVAAADALGDGLSARAGGELGHQGTDVEFHGVFGDVETPGDFLVADALGEELEDFLFAGREHGVLPNLFGGHRKDDEAGGGRFESGADFDGRRAGAEYAAGALVDELVGGLVGKHDYRDRRRLLRDVVPITVGKEDVCTFSRFCHRQAKFFLEERAQSSFDNRGSSADLNSGHLRR